MTYADAVARLGPDAMAQVAAEVADWPPLTPEQIAQLSPLLAPLLDTLDPASSDAA